MAAGATASAAMLALFGTGVGLWLAYGLMAGAWPVVAANALTVAQVLAIVVLRWRRAAERSPATAPGSSSNYPMFIKR